jgi:hypothetical protein
MILTKQQADVIRTLLSNNNLVIGRKKNIGSCVVFDSTTGIALLVAQEDSKTQVPMAIHGRVINDMVAKDLLSTDSKGDYRLTEVSATINKEDLVDFTANGKARVTDLGIRTMAAKYGYSFEFQRVVGIAMFTKEGEAVVETSIRIDRLSDKSITEWESHLSSYIRTI